MPQQQPYNWYEPTTPYHTHSQWYGAEVLNSLGPGQGGNETLANNYYSY
ncbi:hypothetical protein DOY81_001467 [Sarcophaga bullata]|nr:hypothetical protein DOY81_001467 [Sarcophaga bullata]